MKKIIVFLFILLLSVPAMAEMIPYRIDENNVYISLPESWFVFYEGMSQDSPALEAFGMSLEQAEFLTASKGNPLWAIYNDFATEMTIDFSPSDGSIDLNQASMYELKVAGDTYGKQLQEYGATFISSKPYESKKYKFMRLTVSVPFENEVDYRMSYLTTSGNSLVSIVFTSIDNPFTSQEEEMFDKIVDTLIF